MVPKNTQIEAICREVSRIIREIREKRGLSMTELAARSGLSRAMISFVESEFRNPSLETLLRISLALETDLAEIIRDASKRAGQ